MTAALPGAGRQLLALLALRWQMVRSDSIRLAIGASLAVVALLLNGALSLAGHLTPAQLTAVLEIAPTAYLGFGLLAFIAPLTSGGGNDMVPADQLAAFPVRPRTAFLGGLVLAPLNLVWVLQLLAIATETACLTVRGGTGLAVVTSLAYVCSLTFLGQAFAWAVLGLRGTRAGRRLVGTVGTAAVLGVVAVVRLGRGDDVLRHSPTRTVVRGVAAAGDDLERWGGTTGVLLALSVAGLVLGARTCSWALRRPADSRTRTGTSTVRRRAQRPSALGELVAMDRASVWRAPALRRGGLVLGVLPGVITAGAHVPWQSLAVLPGLIAAGAGLLFGINAFSLDGTGAIWLCSLPVRPRQVAVAKLLVLGETVLAAVLVAVLSGATSATGPLTPTVLVAVVACTVSTVAVVLAGCVSMSVRRPHRADLAGPRDAIAPPGAMAAASARLAVPAGVVGIMLGSTTSAGHWWLSPLLGTPVVAGAVVSLRRNLRRYDDPVVRARVMQAVSAG